MPQKLTLFLYESWDMLDEAVEGLTPVEATTRHDGGSSIAWTIGHVTTMVDSWINVNFQGLPPHPIIGGRQFSIGGTGEWSDWTGIRTAAGEVRHQARLYLDSEPPIDRVVPYQGSIQFLRGTGLRLSYALMRIAAHHFIHTGEIITIRSRLGHDTDRLARPDWGRPLA